MSLYRIKGSPYWHYSFQFKGRDYQGSTDCSNRNNARQVETAERDKAGMEFHGVLIAKSYPLFKEFIQIEPPGRFMADVRQQHASKPNTIRWYKEKMIALLRYPAFQHLRLNEIDENIADQFSKWRAKQQSTKSDNLVSTATVNGELRALRHVLTVAFEWRLIPRLPKIKLIAGETGRTFVLTGEIEARYLSLARYPLLHAATLMLDEGLRPEEVVCLRKADLIYSTAEGMRPPTGVSTERLVSLPVVSAVEAVIIRSGKTKKGKRSLPLTKRSAEVIAELCALFPRSEWLFPGQVDGHLGRHALNTAHMRLLDKHEFPEELVLYSCRHTFGTRLAESGASPFAIMKAMGHANIRESQRYIHLSDESISRDLARKEAFDKALRRDGMLRDEIIHDNNTRGPNVDRL